MSLPVWPSAFIRAAVAMCSASSTLRGRPNRVPLAREVAQTVLARPAQGRHRKPDDAQDVGE